MMGADCRDVVCVQIFTKHFLKHLFVRQAVAVCLWLETDIMQVPQRDSSVLILVGYAYRMIAADCRKECFGNFRAISFIGEVTGDFRSGIRIFHSFYPADFLIGNVKFFIQNQFVTFDAPVKQSILDMDVFGCEDVLAFPDSRNAYIFILFA